MTGLTIALAGNPNCGKTTLFNALTGRRQKVGNWPGVTVEMHWGQRDDPDGSVTVVDLPGLYSLTRDTGVDAQDVKVTRDFLASNDFDLLVNVVDASNLERNLILTAELLDQGVPMMIALTKMDLAAHRGMAIDLAAISPKSGCPIVALSALKNPDVSPLVATARRIAKPDPNANRLPPRPPAYRTEPERTDSHLCFARETAQAAIKAAPRSGPSWSDRLDNIALHRVFGPLVFLGLIYLMFLMTINLGGAFIDFFDQAAAALFIDGLGSALTALGLPNWLRVVLADGIGGGIQVVATFVPIIGLLYLFLAFLEDSGYMARAACLMDRAMRRIGLPGKAFVPLIIGFGCNVPSIMATRTLERQRERVMTTMMAPFMSCGARLAVYALFVAAFFPTGGQNMVFALYLAGIAMAILTGLLLKKTLLPGESAPLALELPPYNLPRPKGLLISAWTRLRGFVTGAGKIIVIVVAILTVANSLGRDGTFGHQDSENSLLSAVGQVITPLLSPLGIEEENWPAAVGVFTGIFAKEAVVGTLDALYAGMAATPPETPSDTDSSFDLGMSLLAAVQTIPENLNALTGQLLDPLGVGIASADKQGITAELALSNGTLGAMAARFDGKAGAFAYLLFILLYTPCVAALGAINRELGGRWTVFAVCWTTGTAFAVSTAFYQLARFAQHPMESGLWLTGIGIALAGCYRALRRVGKSRSMDRPVTAAADRPSACGSCTKCG